MTPSPKLKQFGNCRYCVYERVKYLMRSGEKLVLVKDTIKGAFPDGVSIHVLTPDEEPNKLNMTCWLAEIPLTCQCHGKVK